MSSPNPNLHTANLTLRPAVSSDAAALAALFANPLNTQHEPHKPRNPTAEEYQNRIAKWTDLRARGQAYFLVVTRRQGTALSSSSVESQSQTKSHSASDSVIGFGGINAIFTDTEGKRIADVGVLIDSSEWRKGYGREALHSTLDFAFRKPEAGGVGCDEVFFETLAVNTPFQALADSLGLARWKRLKKEGKEGETEVEYRLGREEWEGISDGGTIA